MSTRARLRTGALAGSLTVLLAMATPAFAQAPDAPAATSTEDPVVAVVDEDTDQNDGVANNLADDGDNEQPSDNDRSVENGGSGNQGSSESDPDGTLNGGADFPGGSGGTDLADQDGNNGCGNDDDFEDDNNGNCGGARPGDVTPGSPLVPNTGNGATDTGNGGSDTGASGPVAPAAVLGTTVEGTTSALATSKATPTLVIGLQEARSPQSLARTGLNTAQLALVSIGMIAVGFITLRTRSRVLALAGAS